MENGAKLQGYITTDYGLKDVYEPSESTYSTKEKQIRYVPHIKITGVTYDVELEYENAPSGVELPKIVSVNAGHKLVLPEIDGYDIVILDEFGKEITDEIFVEKNMKVKVKLAQIDYEQDKDGDGLFDIFEKMVGTDPDNIDTDGDGLTDGFEYNYLTTDPLLKDTDGNKVSDADEDFDNDGLSNIEEQRLNTDPSSSDTDGDALKDADEVNVYKTNPLLRDTDNDGIDDADEIKLGLYPTNPSSDGVTLDSERKFEQVADDSIKDDSLLNSNNFLIPIVSGNVPGNISKNVKIEKSYSSTFNENRSVLSDIIHLEKTYKEQLTLSFQFKEKYVGDIKNISIVSYSKTGLKLVDTKIDENNLKIYGEISENADYFVIDVDEFLKGLGIDVFANVIEEVDFVKAKMYSDNNAFVAYDKFENKNYSDDYSKLDDYSAVKLSDTIDKIGINDTDNDGLSDAEELGISIEKSMMSFIELLLNRNNIPKENYTGKKTINVWEYISNPTLIDTDYDGIPDGEKDYDEISTVSMFNSGGYRSIKIRLDEEPRSGEFEATAYWNEGDKNFSTKNPIQFTVDYTMFFENNKNYKSDIAKLAWLYAFDIYSYNPEKETEDNVFIKTTKVPNINTKNDNTKLQKTFGMKDVENIVINKDNYSEDKDNITEIVIGHRKVEYNGKEKEIVLLVVRGTNGTHSEWSSNFDVGADTKQYYDATGEKHPHWKNKYNHKGFDVTANRVIEKVNGYLSRHSLNSGSILITGHSRGAAVANLLGKYFVDSKKFDVYTYAFATPNNTTTKNIGNYNEIFNIVNDDDLIPYMPLTKWEFNKYGQIKRISVKDNYEDSSAFGDKKYTFEWLTGEDYNPDGGTKRTIDAFGKLANNREELYVMDSSNDGKAIENEYRSTNYNEATARIKKCKEDLETEKLLRFSKVEIEKDSGTLVSFYRAKVNYCPAYAMQTLANMASEVGPKTGRNLSGKYNSAKWSFIGSSGGIKIKEKAIVGGMIHPHMPITYYLIVNNDFKNI